MVVSGRLAGKAALITGASRGIGLAIAEAYTREGADLFLTATNATLLESVRDELAATGVKIETHAADLTDEAALFGMFKAAADWGERHLNVFVNNAGAYIGKPFASYTMDEFDRLMKINVYSVFQLTQLAVTHLREIGGGKIVNIASTAGKWESPNQSVYNMTKHAVVGMNKCVALETAGQAINVNAICPGLVDTDMLDNLQVAAEKAGIPVDQVRAATLARVPIGRFLEAEEIAHLAVYFGSEESNGMTGQTITISGGMRMG